jgi:hypothetical protein
MAKLSSRQTATAKQFPPGTGVPLKVDAGPTMTSRRRETYSGRHCRMIGGLAAEKLDCHAANNGSTIAVE